MAWQLALAVFLFALFVAGSLYAIVRWIYSDAPRGTPLPWQRRRRRRHPDNGTSR